RGRLQPLTTRKQVTNPAPQIRTARPPSPPREQSPGRARRCPRIPGDSSGKPSCAPGPGRPRGALSEGTAPPPQPPGHTGPRQRWRHSLPPASRFHSTRR
ncbi:unnamed protein product, partial [Rangifer tarandus platyrhynchus]